MAAGTVIADKYRITGSMGKGRAAEVYAAQQISDGAPVALKILSPALSTAREYLERFHREAQILAHLRHPSIVDLYDFGRTPDGLFYMAMEPLNGQTLTAAVRQGGPMELQRALGLLEQLLSALETAHAAGIVHRDVRPGNIIVMRDASGAERIKVLDFGVARTTAGDSKQLTAFGSMLGMPEYAAPEQIRGQNVDARTDLYAVGCVAMAMLTGGPPFGGSTQVELMVAQMSHVPPKLRDRRPALSAAPAALEDWVARALAKDADKRFPDATRMRMMLGGIIAGMSAVAPKNFNEAVVPLAGEIIPGYVDIHGAPNAAPLRPATPPLMSASAVSGARPASATAPPRVAPAAPAASGHWKGLAIAAGIGFVVILGVLLAVLLR